MKKERIILISTILFLSAMSANLTSGQTNYPNRVVEIISPNAAGGGLDFALQLFKPKLEKILGQPVIINYKAVAGGVGGTLYVKECKPDGYTLMGSTFSTLVIAQMTKKGASYKLDDFTPICNLTSVPTFFCVKEDSPYKTMQDFIRMAKTKKMKYASPGTYYSAHILMEALSKRAGFQAIHIPQTGTAAGMTAVLGGHLDILVAASSGFTGPGKLRIIAAAEEKRLEDYPDVPTLKELGYPLVVENLDSLWAPKGVPQEIVNRLFQAHKKAYLENKGEMDRLAKMGEQRVFLLEGEDLGKRYRDHYDFFKEMLEEMGAVKQ
jgi:tripartite-type tricarboxylate transporter receptor subunit TctC